MKENTKEITNKIKDDKSIDNDIEDNDELYDDITRLARRYSDRHDTCSFNFYGQCNVNPEFRSDVIKLIKKYAQKNK